MVKLTREEEEILNGRMGEAKAKALEVIVRVAESLDAERLVNIRHAHISGVSYGTIGDPGKAFISELYRLGARFEVPATVNPIGYDDEVPTAVPFLDVDDNFIRGQAEIIKALVGMGARAELTCTPYETVFFRSLGLKVGESVAWGESSAVAYANTVLGLRTNREGGPLALLSAIVGKTYYYGLHVPENRIPSIAYRVEPQLIDEVDAGIVAEILAEIHEDMRPPLVLMGVPEGEYRSIVLREFAAALGAAGSIGMAVIPGVTPDYRGGVVGAPIGIEKRVLLSRRKDLAPTRKPDIVFIGCPHATEAELRLLDYYLRDNAKIPILVTLSKDAYKRNVEVVRRLSRRGVLFARSTCLIVSRLKSRDYAIATNSYKAYFYLRRKVGSVGMLTLPRLVELALGFGI